MADRPQPTFRHRQLLSELRRLRDASGMTLEQVGKEMGVSGATVSRIETAQVRPKLRDIQALLDIYQVKGERKRQSLLQLTRDLGKKGWWNQYTDTLSGPYLEYISLEGDAVSLGTYEPQMVHGLLQTENYTRAMADEARSRLSADRLDAIIAAREARKSVLHRADQPTSFDVVLDEAVIRRMVGGPSVMREQLLHLVELSEQPNIELQVLPFQAGAPTWIGGPFALLEFATPADLWIVYVENMTDGLYLEDDDKVGRYRDAFHQLRTAALDPEQSKSLILATAKTLEGPTT